MVIHDEHGCRPYPRFHVSEPKKRSTSCKSCGKAVEVPIEAAIGVPTICSACFAAGLLDPTVANTFEQLGATAVDGTALSPQSAEYKQMVIDVVNVNAELLRLIRREPTKMRMLSPRKFEELVAEILARTGYTVQLTPATRDGGFDIAAARHDHLGTFRYLIECKRYAPQKRVGVELVRSLYGVVEKETAAGGIIVTTSFFTRGAQELQRTLSSRMALCDYTKLQDWLRKIA